MRRPHAWKQGQVPRDPHHDGLSQWTMRPLRLVPSEESQQSLQHREWVMYLTRLMAVNEVAVELEVTKDEVRRDVTRVGHAAGHAASHHADTMRRSMGSDQELTKVISAAAAVMILNTTVVKDAVDTKTRMSIQNGGSDQRVEV